MPARSADRRRRRSTPISPLVATNELSASSQESPSTTQSTTAVATSATARPPRHGSQGAPAPLDHGAQCAPRRLPDGPGTRSRRPAQSPVGRGIGDPCTPEPSGRAWSDQPGTRRAHPSEVTMTRSYRTGLVLLGVVSFLDVLGPLATDGEHPPMWIALIGSRARPGQPGAASSPPVARRAPGARCRWSVLRLRLRAHRRAGVLRRRRPTPRIVAFGSRASSLLIAGRRRAGQRQPRAAWRCRHEADAMTATVEAAVTSAPGPARRRSRVLAAVLLPDRRRPPSRCCGSCCRTRPPTTRADVVASSRRTRPPVGRGLARLRGHA